MNGRAPGGTVTSVPAGCSEVSLAAAILADPVAVLGRECTARFGPRLPFLLKVLAVARALSIQVHPSPAQAAAGFAEKQAAGIPQGERLPTAQ